MKLRKLKIETVDTYSGNAFKSLNTAYDLNVRSLEIEIYTLGTF